MDARLMRLIELYGAENAVLDEAEPSLVAAVRHRPSGTIYQGQPKDAHWDVAQANGFAGVDWKDRNDLETGFVNHKGHFLNREKALAYAAQHDLLHPNALRYLAAPDIPAELGASFLKQG